MDKQDMQALLKELAGIREALEKIVEHMTPAEPHLEAVPDSQDAHEDDTEDLYEQARKAVVEAGKATTSYVQRKLGIGYARAAFIMDLLEERGIIGPAAGAHPRRLIQRFTPEALATLQKIESQLKKKKKSK